MGSKLGIVIDFASLSRSVKSIFGLHVFQNDSMRPALVMSARARKVEPLKDIFEYSAAPKVLPEQNSMHISQWI